MEFETFKSQLSTPLKEAGFKVAGATWRRVAEDSIAVLNLQKSQWGPAFYVNLGIYYQSLGPETSPPEHRCHVRTRVALKAVAPLVAEALQWFEGVATLEQLAVALKSGGLSDSVVTAAVRNAAAA